MPLFPPPQQAYDYQSGWGQQAPMPLPGAGRPLPPPMPGQPPVGYGVPAPPPPAVAPPSPQGMFGPSAYPSQFGGASPQVPDPALAAHPPLIDPTQTANGTGGPTQPQPQRADVGAQLYRLGKQAPGPANPFGGFGPQMPPPVDPFALLQGAQPPMAPPPPLQAQSTAPMGPPPPDKSPLGAEPHGRFQRLTRLLGHPVVPEPKPKKR